MSDIYHEGNSFRRGWIVLVCRVRAQNSWQTQNNAITWGRISLECCDVRVMAKQMCDSEQQRLFLWAPQLISMNIPVHCVWWSHESLCWILAWQANTWRRRRRRRRSGRANSPRQTVVCAMTRRCGNPEPVSICAVLTTHTGHSERENDTATVIGNSLQYAF